MKVSIIVAVYNTSSYLNKCIDSLINQTLDDIEIIVVDDGSSDGSYDILKSYGDKIVLIHQENSGQAVARNTALKIATGEYVGFVDSDDYVDPNMFLDMYTLAHTTSSDVVICNSVDEYTHHSVYHNVSESVDVFHQTPSACNKIFLREKITFFPENLWYEDFYFTTSFLLQDNIKHAYVNQYYYHATVREYSTMSNDNSLKNLDMLEIMSLLQPQIKDNELFAFLLLHHIVITSVNRVNFQKSKDRKLVMNSFIDYVRVKCSNILKTNAFKTLPKNRKIIAWLNYHYLFKISKILLQVKSKLKK